MEKGTGLGVYNLPHKRFDLDNVPLLCSNENLQLR